MLDMSATALAVVQGSYTMNMRAESWLGGVLLADGIPIADGGENRDRSLAVPEQISSPCPPREAASTGTRAPTPPTRSPPTGRCCASTTASTSAARWSGSTAAGSSSPTLDRGRHGVRELRGPAHPHRRGHARQPRSSREHRHPRLRRPGLVEPALTVSFDGTLVDRAVPLGMQWDSDRLGAVTEVLTAWGAAERVTEDGYLLIEPVSDAGSPGPVHQRRPDTGTVVRWQGSTTRDGAFNCVVAQGEDASGNQTPGRRLRQRRHQPVPVRRPLQPAAGAVPVPVEPAHHRRPVPDRGRRPAEAPAPPGLPAPRP
jgi:hypothetical protein